MRNFHTTGCTELGNCLLKTDYKAQFMLCGPNTGQARPFNQHTTMKNALACAVSLLAFALVAAVSPVYGQAGPSVGKGSLFPEKGIQLIYQATSPGYFDNHSGSVTWVNDENRGGQITHAIWREETPTPFNFSYNYSLSKDSDRGYLMDVKGIMSPFYFMIDDSVKVSYEGDRLFFPNSFQSGQTLPDAKGAFNLEIGNGIPDLRYEVSVSDRKVVAGEPMVIEGQSYETFIHSCRVTTSKVIGARSMEESDIEWMKDWFVPGFGIMKRETGKLTATVQYINQHSDK